MANPEPKVEEIFGFVETYRDPLNLRAEWESIVAITDAEETSSFKSFVDRSTTFLRRLPWTFDCTDNDGKGPFEKSVFVAPAFTSIHGKERASQRVASTANLCSDRIRLLQRFRRDQSTQRCALSPGKSRQVLTNRTVQQYP